MATQKNIFGDLSAESPKEKGKLTRSVPLAERMRPQTLAEIVGQQTAIGPESSLGRILRSSNPILPSIILTGPPGVGKTTIAKVIANELGFSFERISGVLDGVKEIREVVERAKIRNNPTVVLVDEIHRFNRAQQDAFLPHLEDGTITLIGQTTENVSFRIRGALLSRLKVIELKDLTENDLELLVRRALIDEERGLGALKISIEENALKAIARLSMGDARRALTTLEWAALEVSSRERNIIDDKIVRKSMGLLAQPFDQKGDYHYDCISAFIKSMRGSDPDATVYYMVRALEAGEDPLFLTRRMIIFASEDVSCDPRALSIALDVDRSVERLGMPEAKIPMAHAAIYLACAAKSNATYVALNKAIAKNQELPNLAIPQKLKNAPTELMKELGNSNGYNYPHDAAGGWVNEHYLPEALVGTIFYEPTDRGLDAQIGEKLRKLRADRN